MRMSAGLVAAVCCLALASPALAMARAPVADTASGRLVGVRQGEIQAFLGVPYARPPVGPLRWRAPEPAASWTGARDATRFGADCYQAAVEGFGPYTAEYLSHGPVSEDCLYLNIWTPADHKASLPVLVWIHGGGFSGGSGAVPIYDGSRLAAKGVVVVNINYRLGVFGFLAHPELSAESPLHVSGNYGLLDIVAALRWVRANIAAFGGDPSQVTVAGQSAGAAAVNALIVSPDAKGLFTRAIAESGSGMGMNPPALAQAEAMGVAFGETAKAPSAAALRSLTAAALISIDPMKLPEPGHPFVPPRFHFIPVLDGQVLPVDPDRGGGVQSHVPLLTGFNANEAMASAAIRSTPADFERALRGAYGAQAGRFLAAYPHASDDEASASARLLARDSYMASLVMWSERRRAAAGGTIYPYRYDHAEPGPQAAVFGAFHSSEIPYVFGVLDTPGRAFADADRAISDRLQAYWLGFVKTGDPTGVGRPGWPAAAAGEPVVMELGDRFGPAPAVSSPDRLAAFRAYVAAGGQLSLF